MLGVFGIGVCPAADTIVAQHREKDCPAGMDCGHLGLPDPLS
jgi:hypothetical protein